jgi:ABC-2 type transport system ATP-binding protein
MILEAENIFKSFGKKKILKGVSFRMEPGALYGIVGENGSGKSTLLKIIVGELSADKGKVSARGRIGYCPQQAIVFSQLTVEENFKYFSAAYRLKRNAFLQQREFLLRQFNFEKYRNDKVEVLSGGSQQKLNLSLALLHQPDLLILDEPYNGFDWDTYIRFWDFTDHMLETGCSILIVTHLLNETNRFRHVFNLKNGFLE